MVIPHLDGERGQSESPKHKSIGKIYDLVNMHVYYNGYLACIC